MSVYLQTAKASKVMSQRSLEQLDFSGDMLLMRLVITPYRGTDDEKRHLKVMGDLGQIVQLRFDLRSEDQHGGQPYWYNHSTKNFSIADVNVKAARNLARLSKELGLQALFKFLPSELMLIRLQPSTGLKLGEGELAVKEEFPSAIIVRPSTLYGHEDRLMMSQLLYLIWPRAYHYESLVKFFLDVTKRDPTVWHCPRAIARSLLGYAINSISLHTPILNTEIIDKHYVDEVPTGVNTFADAGIEPLVLEETVLRFIKKFRPAEFQTTSYEMDVKKYLRQDLSLKF
ncbi:hypothetical protein BC829DRAFT_420087 [Chytridium lagenaria]|nr:hypothetical protein BC829DRAFT_420087 [Chytridium lagenaria]